MRQHLFVFFESKQEKYDIIISFAAGIGKRYACGVGRKSYQKQTQEEIHELSYFIQIAVPDHGRSDGNILQ